MNHETPAQPVAVTAEERAHPALAKLARACIALARLKQVPPAESASAERDERSDGAEEARP